MEDLSPFVPPAIGGGRTVWERAQARDGDRGPAGRRHDHGEAPRGSDPAAA